MHKEFLMGNAAIALGAVASGVNVVAGYPGTPSTEVLETIAKHRPDDVYVEWSVNEKAAMELAAGASYSGARTLVTMKQVGLNVASDPLMSLEYIGVKGGMNTLKNITLLYFCARLPASVTAMLLYLSKIRKNILYIRRKALSKTQSVGLFSHGFLTRTIRR